MSESPKVYAFMASSLDFLVFYIELKQKITKTHVYTGGMEHVLIHVVYDCFQLGLSFLI